MTPDATHRALGWIPEAAATLAHAMGDEASHAGEGLVVVTPATTDQPRYTISEACVHIDELNAQIARWQAEYQLLAETADEVRESRERLRIRVVELEGVIDLQFSELRTANGEIDALKEANATLAAKVAATQRRG